MKRAIVIDGNYMMNRCFMALQRSKELAPDMNFMFKKQPVESDMQFNSRYQKQVDGYVENLCRHMTTIVNRYAFCQNIIIVRDSGSWRKDMDIKQPMQYVKEGDVFSDDVQKYKGNRVKDDQINWNDVYGKFDEFVDALQEHFGMPVLQVPKAEGDDWLWFVPRYIKKHFDLDTLIYCNDGDITHTIADYIAIARQVVTKVAPAGEMVTTSKLFEAYNQTNNVNVLLVDNLRAGHLNEMFKEVKIGSVQHKVVNPAFTLIKKVFAGDDKDNIPPIAKYTTNQKQYKKPNETTFVKYWESKGISCEGVAPEGMRLLTIDDLYNEEFIRDYLVNCYGVALTKSVKHTLDIEHAMEMYWQNLKLNHLSEKQIPTEIIDSMAEQIREKKDVILGQSLKELKSATPLLLKVRGEQKNDFFNQFSLPRAEMKSEAVSEDQDDLLAMLGL